MKVLTKRELRIETEEAVYIPLSSPDVTDLERKYVDAVLKTPNLSLGPMLPKFESAFAAYVGTDYAIALNSGTSGLHLAMRALDIKDGDTVITTPFSFIASANCILFERARPLFVDIDPVTLNIDPQRIKDCLSSLARENKPMPKAILPVHVFGNPCDMEKIMAISREYGIPVVEDACEAVGTEYKGEKAGSFGKIATFAFYPNKQMTTGEGGMLVTDDPEIARLCRSMRSQGRSDGGGWLLHERLGYNYRLSDINCALGLGQLERIDEIIRKRAAVADMYNERLKDVAGVITPIIQEGAKISWFVYVVTLSCSYMRKDRDRILTGLKSAGIGCNNYFPPIHLFPFYREFFGYREGDFPITEHISERTIALPFFNNLEEEEIDHVVETLKRLL